MKATLRTKRSKVVAAGAAGLMVLGAGAAYAYWASLGSGTTDGTNGPGSAAMSVTSNKVDGLVPGGSIALSGYIANPGDTDAMAGNVLGTVTSVGGDTGSIADYWISGVAKLDANVPKGGSIPWSGLTLHYANSANDQNSGKSAAIHIGYTLTPPGTITGLGTITGATEYGNCYASGGAPGDSGPAFATSTFDKQFQLVKNAEGYMMTVVYGNGTFVGVNGAVSPGACGSGGPLSGANGTTMSPGITGTLAGSWSAQIKTPYIGNANPDCTANKCVNSFAFLTAVFGTEVNPSGTTPANMHPDMKDYSWNVVYNAGPTHGAVTQIGTAGVLSGTGNIK